MKKLIVMFLGITMAVVACAQDGNSIKLNAPNKERGLTIMKALEQRKSTREYADKQLSVQDLSDLLWAANGINRPDEGKRTAPTAMNQQEIDIYVLTADGASLYDAKNNVLQVVTKDDLRPMLAAGQDFVTTAPVVLLIVADASRFRGGDTEHGRTMMACDAGIVSQNISLFCSGCGFVTVPRAMMDREPLAKALGLSESCQLYLNHPVGFAK
jgi:nitroreductase